MRAFCSMLALAAALTLQPAFAQDEDDSAQFEAAMAAAQAQAVRPGDEALTCDQLQTEMTTTMSDPAVQAQIGEMGATAEGMQQQAEQARSSAMTGMAGNMALGVASSFIPGLGYAQMAMQRAQMAQMESQTRENQEAMASMMSNMEAVMPQMMRGQRVYELAQAQQCAFLQEGAPAPQ